MKLVVLRCDSDDLSLASVARDWWVIGYDGIDHHPDWPLPYGTFEDEFFLTCPLLRFSTDANRIRYGLRLGPGWYCSMETSLSGFGENEGVEVACEYK